MADPSSAPAPTTGGYNPLNGTFGNAAPVGGRRHHMKKVSAKTIKRTLKKLGMKPKGRMVLRGGEMEEMADMDASPPAAGRRRGGKKTKRRSASKGKLGILGL